MPPRPDDFGDLDALRRHVLDGLGARAAILHCLYGVAGLFNRHLAAALAGALNDWIAAEWLDREERLRASIVVAPQNAEKSVDEIRRRAADRRFVGGYRPRRRRRPRRRASADGRVGPAGVVVSS